MVVARRGRGHSLVAGAEMRPDFLKPGAKPGASARWRARRGAAAGRRSGAANLKTGASRSPCFVRFVAPRVLKRDGAEGLVQVARPSRAPGADMAATRRWPACTSRT